MYDHSDESWVPIGKSNKQSNCKCGHRVQSRLDFLDCTLSLSIISLTLNLETNEILLDVNKLPYNLEKGYCLTTALIKATMVCEQEVQRQIFEMLRFDAYMVKYQDRYWIENNTDWTLVQKFNKHNNNKTHNKNKAQIATRFEVYSKPKFYCGSTKPLYPTEYEDIFIIYEHGFHMNTGKPFDTNIHTFDNQKIIKLDNKEISRQRNHRNITNNQYYFSGFVNEITHL